MRISDWSSDVCSSDLITDESYWAEKNRGAWLHDRRLRESARRDLADSLIATGIPFFGHGDMAQWSRLFGGVAVQAAGIRRFGSDALSLDHVAVGRFEGCWASDLKPWGSDMCSVGS